MGVYKLKSKIPFGRIADAKISQIPAANQNEDTVPLTPGLNPQWGLTTSEA